MKTADVVRDLLRAERDELRAEVARLTEERDSAVRSWNEQSRRVKAAEAKNAHLTAQLAAAERRATMYEHKEHLAPIIAKALEGRR